VSKTAYIQKQRDATILREAGNYNRDLGEMNPVIFEEFVGLVLDNNLPSVIWEPFASNAVPCRTQNFAMSIDGLTLISFSLKSGDLRVKNLDATLDSPKGYFLGGVLFHPPYFRAQPFSNDRRDIALLDTKEEYLAALRKTINTATIQLAKDGLFCVVCRAYRADGQEIRLDLWMLELFDSAGYDLQEVWSSEPDVILIMKKR
jgi:hypothetical protein